MTLPEFKGNEKESPHLRYPIWKKQWNSIITRYDEDCRDSFLYRHLDDAARSKIIGVASNYQEAMKRLESFYGNRTRVISCVMDEVLAPKDVADCDYSGLLGYSSVL